MTRRNSSITFPCVTCSLFKIHNTRFPVVKIEMNEHRILNMLKRIYLFDLNMNFIPPFTDPATCTRKNHCMLNILVFDHQSLSIWILYKFYFSNVLIYWFLNFICSNKTNWIHSRFIPLNMKTPNVMVFSYALSKNFHYVLFDFVMRNIKMPQLFVLISCFS